MKSVKPLLIYLIIFAVVFFLSMYSYYSSLDLVNLGLPVTITNLILMLLSSLSIAKTVWHIYNF